MAVFAGVAGAPAFSAVALFTVVVDFFAVAFADLVTAAFFFVEVFFAGVFFAAIGRCISRLGL